MKRFNEAAAKSPRILVRHRRKIGQIIPLQGGRGEIAADTGDAWFISTPAGLLQGGRGEIAADT